MEKREEITEKSIGLDEMKVIQLDVLSAIDSFCHDNNIRYSLACGSLLGAIRHKGYIPWDDDIDIYVLREDFNRLIEVFPETFKGRIKLASLKRDSNWELAFAKAYDDNTVLIENTLRKGNYGVGIDVFPIDEVPDDEKEWQRYNKKRRLQQILFLEKCNPLKKHQSILKNAGKALIHIFFFFYPRRKWAKNLDRLAQKNNGKGFKRCFECCQGLFQKNPFPKELFDDIVEVPFEDRKFKAFSNADLYLKNGFGDYMKLPPIEERVTHHYYKAYWK